MSISYNKDVIKKYFDKKELKYIEDDNRFELIVPISSDTGITFGRAIIRVREDDFYLRLISPINVPENRRRTLCQYLCSVNYTLLCGCFEIDLSDGELAYKIYHHCGESGITTEDIHRSLAIAVTMMDNHSKGLVNLIFGPEIDPIEYFQCEQEAESDRDEETPEPEDVTDAEEAYEITGDDKEAAVEDDGGGTTEDEGVSNELLFQLLNALQSKQDEDEEEYETEVESAAPEEMKGTDTKDDSDSDGVW